MRNPITMMKSYSSWYGHPNWLAMALAKATSISSVVEVQPQHVLHSVCLRTKTTDLPMYHQVFTSRQYDVALRRSPRTILDCGGNVGFAAVYWANVYPSARILSIEPELANYSLLVKNVAPYPNVVPLHAAVWKYNTLLDVRDDGAGDCSFQTQEPRLDGRHKLVGKTIGLTIDTIMKLSGMDQVDFLKIDIEGAEEDIFIDPSAWIKNVGVMAIEIHEDMKPGCRALIYRSATRQFEFEMQNGENIFFAKSDFVDAARPSDWRPISERPKCSRLARL